MQTSDASWWGVVLGWGSEKLENSWDTHTHTHTLTHAPTVSHASDLRASKHRIDNDGRPYSMQEHYDVILSCWASVAIRMHDVRVGCGLGVGF